MLEMERNIEINGSSVINGKQAASYQAKISSDNPSDMNISYWQMDKALYKENRASCRSDQAEFEEAAYALQEELIAKKASTSE